MKGEKEMDECDRKLCQTPDSDNDNEERSPSNDTQNKKQRKPRTAFSDSQLQSLEKSFERQKYLSVQERMELAAKLQIADAQVKCWFQNRRWYDRASSSFVHSFDYSFYLSAYLTGVSFNRTKWKRQNSMQFEAADLFPALRQMFPFSNFSVRDVLPTYRPQLPMFPTFENSFNPYLRPMWRNFSVNFLHSQFPLFSIILRQYFYSL